MLGYSIEVGTSPAVEKAVVVVADDDRASREHICQLLRARGLKAIAADSGQKAIDAVRAQPVDLVALDLNMPGLNGIEVITRAKELIPDCDSIVLTGKSSLDTAIAALRQGAFDYLTKPCKLVELQSLLKRVSEKRELTNKYRALQRRLQRFEGDSDLIGASSSMDKVRNLTTKVAPRWALRMAGSW